MKSEKDILIVAHFSGRGGTSNNRFRELASIVGDRGASVELLTSSFLHQAKQHREPEDDSSLSYRVIHVDEPGYSSNVSIQRILSHRKLGKNLASYLEERPAPDVIYCALPSLAVGEAVASYAGKHKVPLIWDVQDLWPEAFEMAIKPAWAARLGLTPLRLQADRLYRAADAAVTVSDTYSERVRRARGFEKEVLTFYLGTNLTRFDRYAPSPLQGDESRINLVYIGTLGHSYDLPLVFDALRLLRDSGRDYRLHVMGDGPLQGKWEDQTRDLQDDVVFYGRLDYPEMVAKLISCDIALNPIVPGSAGSIVNKVCDYAAAGLPVVSTQYSDEYRRLLAEFQAGISCDADATELARTITRLSDDPALRQKLAEGSRNLAESNFDRALTYQGLANLILDHA